jgi:hypothetical protein
MTETTTTFIEKAERLHADLPAVLYGATLMLSSEPSAIHGEKGARFRAATNKPIAPIVKK